MKNNEGLYRPLFPNRMTSSQISLNIICMQFSAKNLNRQIGKIKSDTLTHELAAFQQIKH